MNDRNRLVVLIAVLVGLTALVYLPALRNGFIWDDDDHLTANPSVNSPSGLCDIWTSLAVSRYYPLTLTTFWLQRRCWGLNPLPYHAVNIVFHAVNAVLLFLLLRRLGVRGAWAGAALWALHPVNVESVAWITELKNTQSTLFLLLSLLAFMRFWAERRLRWYWLSLLAGTAALLSKPSAVCLPALALLCLWWQQGRCRRADAWWVAPFVALGIGISLLAVAEQHRHVLGAGTDEWQLSIPQRLLMASTALWFYAGKLLYPHPLIFVYPRWDMNATTASAWLPLVGIGVVVAFLWWRRAHREAQAGLFGLGCFVVALFPVLGFLNIYYFRFSLVADHFNYLGSAAGLALMAAAGARWLADRRLQITALIAALAVCGGLTWTRAAVFRNDETLWNDTLAKNPEAAIAHNNLGLVLRDRGEWQAACAHFRAATRLNATLWQAPINLGKTLLNASRPAEALPVFEDAHRRRPDAMEPRLGLGMTLTQLGRFDEAIVEFQHALAEHPDDSKLHYWLGKSHAGKGNLRDAAPEYLRAMELDPHFADAYLALGFLRQQQGETERARQCFRRVLVLLPGDERARAALARMQPENDLIPNVVPSDGTEPVPRRR